MCIILLSSIFQVQGSSSSMASSGESGGGSSIALRQDLSFKPRPISTSLSCELHSVKGFQYHVLWRAHIVWSWFMNRPSYSGPKDSQVRWGPTTSLCMSWRRKGSTCWSSTWPPSVTHSPWKLVFTLRCELPLEAFFPSLTGLSCLSTE